MQDTKINKYALEMKKVSKRFPGTKAVEQVDFSAMRGEVHAVVGENGAGKSTLMKILAGSFNDYTGRIFINGEEVKLHSPAIAKKNRIEMIYQELSLAMPISIAENILVGRLPVRFGYVIDSKNIIEETKKCLERVGLDYLHPETPIEEISQHEAQLVEIAKALGNDPLILVMDEPTSALSKEEIERLFIIIRKLKQDGLAIIYISHNLAEIFSIADRVTVLRDGQKIQTKKIAEVNREEIVQMMVGRSVNEFYSHTNHSRENIKIKVENLTRFGFFHNVSFHAYEGEILGICGLSGSGRSELARVLVGLDKKDRGKVFIDEKEVNPKNMAEGLEHGIAYLTENRKTEGLVLRLEVGENILAGLIPKHSKFGIYNKKSGVPVIKKLINELSIFPAAPGIEINNLSGGNQQKVLLAKWIACEPKVLILDEPTRGVDIGAKMMIHKSIEKLTKDGHTIILISSDLPELVALSGRIMIMQQGHLFKEMKKEECTEESILLAANEIGGCG